MSLLGNLFGTSSSNINVVELKEKLSQKDPNVFYMDVRTKNEYKSNGLKQFKNIPVDQVPNRLSEIPKDKEVVVICQSGGRSSSAVRFLKQNAYENVTNVTGGMGAWSMQRL